MVCELLNSDLTRLDIRSNDTALILIRYFNGQNSVPCSSVIYLHTTTRVVTLRHSACSLPKGYK